MEALPKQMHPNYSSHRSNSWATFPTLVFKGEKTKQLILSTRLLNFRTNHPRPGLRVIWNKIAGNERTFPVDPNPWDAGTRPLVAELLCSSHVFVLIYPDVGVCMSPNKGWWHFVSLQLTSWWFGNIRVAYILWFWKDIQDLALQSCQNCQKRITLWNYVSRAW